MSRIRPGVVALLAALLIGGLGVSSAIADDLPNCRNLGNAKVGAIAPGGDLPANVAGYIGAWEGNWGSTASAMAFTKMDGDSVKGVYVFDFVEQKSATTYEPQDDGSLKYTNLTNGVTTTFVWSLSADGQTLNGVRTQSNFPDFKATTSMSRCAP